MHGLVWCARAMCAGFFGGVKFLYLKFAPSMRYGTVLHIKKIVVKYGTVINGTGSSVTPRAVAPLM